MIGRRLALRLSALGLAVVSLASCGLFVSFDDYDTSRAFTVGGTAKGVDTNITALLNGVTLELQHDGPFVFPTRLADGTPFAVTISAKPADQTCSIENPEGTIAGANVTNVTIRCASNDTALTSLVLSKGALSPPFDPTLDHYTSEISLGTHLSDGREEITVTAAAKSPSATIQINGTPVTSGVPSPGIPVEVGQTVTVEVVVTAESGASRRTSIDVTAKPADVIYLKASNTREDAHFGRSVALSGDTLVVGSPQESSGSLGVNGAQGDESAPSAGAAYVFVRTGATWSQQAYLKASNTHENTSFGVSVAISGDTIVVGSSNEGSDGSDPLAQSAPSAGAAYVFTRSGTTWSQQGYLKASNVRANAAFGSSVAISGDTIVVGARRESSGANGVDGNQADTSAPGAGAAYVFTRTGTTWSQQAYLKASNTTSDAEFGFAVALDGDTIAVGAPGPNVTPADPGAAYVFTRAGGTWSQQGGAKNAPVASRKEAFGFSLALDGDALAVGANKAADAGAAYVFMRSGTTWPQAPTAPIPSDEASAGALFGTSVAITAGALVVGAPSAPGPSPVMGASYLFARGESLAFDLRSELSAPPEALFGQSVALSEEALAVGAPGDPSCAKGVGAPAADTGCPEAGAVYVYR